jgi:PAS domain S-box-containing protein
MAAATFQGFQALVENSPDAISLTNEQGEILYGSAANTKLFGYLPAELVGRDCIELLHPEDRKRSTRVFQQVVSEPPVPRRWDARVRCKDGSYCWVESTASNLTHDLDVQAIVLHQRDVQARIEAQTSFQQQSDELLRSNLRMEEFAYTVAHDLREPLRAISVYTELLLSGSQLDADSRQMAAFVVEGAARMSRMISDLLSFARTGMHSPPLPLKLDHAVQLASQNLKLEIDDSAAKITVKDLPTVPGDETHFVCLFQNLISNAIKYRGEAAPAILISAARSGNAWLVTVKDNSIGIAPEHQSKIFQPFVRLANRDIPGTGLGLAVCKRIVEAQGGTIWVESKVGEGSTIAFSIMDAAPDAIRSIDR